MKATKFFKLIGIILISLVLTGQAHANTSSSIKQDKKSVTLTVDKPVIQFMAKAFADKIDASDILRMKNVAGQIDYLTVSFRDKDAADYILKFKPLDEQGLEDWMFDEGYLTSNPNADQGVGNAVTAKVPATKLNKSKAARTSVNLTIDKPIIEFLTKIYSDQIHADDIARVQKVCDQIDHVTVSFVDQDAADYVLTFKSLDDRGLENWMFNEGYLISDPDPAPAVVEPTAFLQALLQ